LIFGNISRSVEVELVNYDDVVEAKRGHIPAQQVRRTHSTTSRTQGSTR